MRSTAIPIAPLLVASTLAVAAFGVATPVPAAQIHPSNLAFLDSLGLLLSAQSDPTGALLALDAAEAALDARAQLLGTLLDPGMARLIEEQRAKIATVRLLLSVTEVKEASGPLARAVALAQAALVPGLGPKELAPLRPVERPSEAISEIVRVSGGSLAAADHEYIERLDALEPSTRDALTSLLSAFLSFGEAARETYEDLPEGDPIPLVAHATSGAFDRASESLSGVQDVPIDGSRLALARSALLEASLALHEALASSEISSDSQKEGKSKGSDKRPRCEPFALPPYISIDLDSCKNTYKANFFLVIDGGGDDRYLNNAGGAYACGTCDPSAAAVIDLAGDDKYVSGGTGGVNGGAAGKAAGFLLDAEGNDRYEALQGGVNGGGSGRGSGFLVDAVGRDTYVASNGGVNGGGLGGYGFLLDAGKENDVYSAIQSGVNGGTEAFVQAASASGFLFDEGGDDVYLYHSYGGNGGAASGKGFLFDAGGSDRYVTTERLPPVDDGMPRGAVGVNGGAVGLGTGFLFDLIGDDVYEGSGLGVNGGAASAIGMIVDSAGDDQYLAAIRGVNGGADVNGVGFVVDGSGDDRYVSFWPGGIPARGVNGGAYFESAGLLVDLEGNDRYDADSAAVNGGVAGLCDPPSLVPECPEDEAGSVGLLVDAMGADFYFDNDGGAGPDQTLVPKGKGGAQVDLPILREEKDQTRLL